MARGLNFAVSSNVIPKQQILVEIEKGIQKLPEHSANLIRNQIVSVLNNKRKIKKNLTNNEKKALLNLSKNNEISICKADKGNCTVILDRIDYYEKLLLLLKDETTYKAIKQDQTKSIERRLNAFIFDLLKRNCITKQQYYFLRSNDSCAPRLYGLPKVHKKDFPMRPIISFINSPLYNLSKYLSKLLSPLVGKTKFTVKNSYQFVDLLKDVNVESNECMVSFDVVSLFTKIPVNLAKDVTIEQLRNDVTLNERTEMTINDIEIALNFCLYNTYFKFQGKFYQQIFGVPMGSPISVTIANLVMEHIEIKAINSFFSPPKLWSRFVDDTFVILKSDIVKRFFAHINSIEASIKFTIEYEKEDKLPFLDILVMKKKSGTLATKIYRKETHTNRYLNYESYHSQQQKQGIIISLLNRLAKLITDSKDFNEEKEMLRRTLEDNNYPHWLIKKTFNRFRFNKMEKHEISKNYKGTVTLPYFQDLTEILSRIIKKQNIRVYTKPFQTIKQILPNLKDSIEPKQQPGVIYEIPCLDCVGIYIGETGRAFLTRCKEHMRDVNSKNLARLENNDINNKSALVKHVYSEKHHMNSNNSKILAKEADYIKRRFLESFFIHFNNDAFNDKTNCFYPNAYYNLKF